MQVTQTERTALLAPVLFTCPPAASQGRCRQQEGAERNSNNGEIYLNKQPGPLLSICPPLVSQDRRPADGDPAPCGAAKRGRQAALPQHRCRASAAAAPPSPHCVWVGRSSKGAGGRFACGGLVMQPSLCCFQLPGNQPALLGLHSHAHPSPGPQLRSTNLTRSASRRRGCCCTRAGRLAVGPSKTSNRARSACNASKLRSSSSSGSAAATAAISQPGRMSLRVSRRGISAPAGSLSRPARVEGLM